MDRNNPIAAAAYELVQDALLPPAERIKAVLASLPVIGKEGVDLEEPCPICLLSFEGVFKEEEERLSGKERAEKNEGEGQEEDWEDVGGVTKLVGCGHVFCRKE